MNIAPTTLGARTARPTDSAQLWVPVAAGAAILALQLPSAAALVIGLLVATVVGSPAWSHRLGQRILGASVVALGFGLDLGQLAAVGVDGMAMTMGTLAVTFGLGLTLARRLGLPRDLAVLLCGGTAICGGSAIAALAPALRARPAAVATALGVVFALNAVALVVFPLVGSGLGLDAETFGMWCAMAIHDTSSVVGAAGTQGQEALEVATMAKLSRSLWIVPVGLLVALTSRGSHITGMRIPRVPTFLILFVLAAAAATWIPGLRPVGREIAGVAPTGLTLALLCVGLSLSPAALRRSGPRAFGLGVTLWAVLACGTLAWLTIG